MAATRCALMAPLLLLALAGACLGFGTQQAARTLAPMSEAKMSSYGAMVKKMQKESMGQPDPNVGLLVGAMGPEDPRNPEELGSYMEGDMLHMRAHVADMPQDMDVIWPGGIVHYTINGNFNGEHRAQIMRAIGEYHKHTCIRFEPYTGREKDYISIQNDEEGCFSDVGRSGGAQVLNLQVPGCLYKVGTTIHELMHALGFLHEQSRADRDRFVEIAHHNIQPGRANNFKKSSDYDGFGVNYDYGSVMHYSRLAFTKNMQPTIIPKSVTSDMMGQRNGFSVTDIRKVNHLYNCDTEAITTTARAFRTLPRATTTPAAPITETTSKKNSFWKIFYNLFKG